MWPTIRSLYEERRGSGAAGVFVDKYKTSDTLAITFGLVNPNAALSHSTHNPNPTLSL
jgi:hypothetical protein